MFDLTTIITLVAPAVVAPFACLGCLWAIRRAEAARQPEHRSAAAASNVLELDSATAPLTAEPVAGRNVA